MTLQQKFLWRQTAWIGIITGLIAVLSLAGDLSLGLNQAYYRQAVESGIAPALVELNSSLDYVGITLLGIVTFIPRLLMGILYIIMLRHCWIPTDKVLTIEIFRLVMNSATVLAILTGICQFVSLLYLQDSERYIVVVLAKLGNLLLSFLFEIGMGMIFFYAYPQIPRWLGVALGVWIGIAITYTVLSANPGLTSFFGIFMAHGAGMILGFYMLWRTSLQVPTPSGNQ